MNPINSLQAVTALGAIVLIMLGSARLKKLLKLYAGSRVV